MLVILWEGYDLVLHDLPSSSGKPFMNVPELCSTLVSAYPSFARLTVVRPRSQHLHGGNDVSELALRTCHTTNDILWGIVGQADR